jgi:hypothetical protein
MDPISGIRWLPCLLCGCAHAARRCYGEAMYNRNGALYLCAREDVYCVVPNLAAHNSCMQELRDKCMVYIVV